MNLYQKIIEVRKVASGFSKDTKGFGYEYVSGNQILNKIKDKMNEVGLILQPSAQVGEHQLFCYTNAKGQEKVDIQVWGDMAYTWINAENPEEREIVSWAYYGQQDDISKSFGSALTYSERYFLLKYFGLPTDEDDPDGKDTSGKTKPQSTTKALSEAQIKRLFALGQAAGYQKVAVIDQIQKKFKKEPDQLTKLEYDQVCKGYEAKANEGK
jgi:hypothetical protein